MSTETVLKNNERPQLFFAVGLFVGSFFLFLGVNLTPFLFAGSGFESQVVFEVPGKEPFLQASLSSKHYPIRVSEKKLLELEADSFLVFDLQNDELLVDYQIDKKLPIASITKLINALVIKKNEDFYSQKGYLQIPPLENFPVEPRLKRRAEYSYRDLFQAMLAASNNEAAYTFAEEYPGGKKAFLKAMDRTAEKVGMVEAEFSNPAGFDKNGGNYATAKGILELIRKLLRDYPKVLEITLDKRIEINNGAKEEVDYLYNTNYFVHQQFVHQQEDVLQLAGQKTGHTSLAGDCMVLIEKGEFGKIIYILLGSKDRVAEMKKLINWTHETYKFGSNI